MTKKQNLMLDAGKLDNKDLKHISWWLKGYCDFKTPPPSLQQVMLVDREALKDKAALYFKTAHAWRNSATTGTYRKLFGEYHG